MNTGFTLEGFPSMGAWVSYALGTENQDLPAYVAIPDPRGVPQQGPANWTNGFLPGRLPGDAVQRRQADPPTSPGPTSIAAGDDRAARDFLKLLNDEHLKRNPGDTELAARIAAYELAARMQLSAPEVERPVAARRRRRRPSTASTTPNPITRRLRPQLPAGPAAAGARRALRQLFNGGLRDGRGRRQLGRPPAAQDRLRPPRPDPRPARCRRC